MLDVKNISKNFGNLKAVDSLSLKIDKGDIYGLLGPNGAGKSTTINTIFGLLMPDSGEIVIDNKYNPSEISSREKIGVIPQQLAIYEDLTAEENLLFFGKLYGIKGDLLKNKVQWALDFSGLLDRKKSLVKTFSGGMKRRLNIVSALLHDPDLILMDEPTVGVDPQSRNSIFDNIINLKKQGKTILYTTHYMEEAQRLCDTVSIMDHGKILATGSVDQLITTHGGKSTLTVTMDGETKSILTDNAISELDSIRKDHTISDFKLEKPNLETVFLNLTGRHLRD